MDRPRAIDVKPLEDYKLAILFSNGEEKVFDVGGYLAYKFFAKLQKPAYFKLVRMAD